VGPEAFGGAGEDVRGVVGADGVDEMVDDVFVAAAMGAILLGDFDVLGAEFPARFAPEMGDVNGVSGRRIRGRPGGVDAELSTGGAKAVMVKVPVAPEGNSMATTW